MSNFNEILGIRYGVISPHSISSWSLDEIYQNGTDPIYEESREDFESGLISAIKDYCENNSNCCIEDRDINIDSIMDRWNDSYESDGSGIMDYSDSEYDLHVSGDNFGIFVMKSPYYTYCRDCSPCAPGAGSLDSPIDKDSGSFDADPYLYRALCLGPEWFDKEESEYSKKIPYRVFRVDNDQEVI